MERDPFVPVSGEFELQADGSWKWTSRVDAAYERHARKKAMKMGAALSAFLLLLVALTDPEELWIALITAAFLLGVCFLTCLFMTRTLSTYRMPYHMTGDSVMIGTGRGSTCVSFRRVHTIETEGNHLILHTRFGQGYVYAPAEDLDQLREWIQRRMTAFPQGNA